MNAVTIVELWLRRGMHEYRYSHSRVRATRQSWQGKVTRQPRAYRSICNYIAMSYIQLQIYWQTLNTYVLGDDSIFGVPAELGHSNIDLISKYTLDLGLTVHPNQVLIGFKPSELTFFIRHTEQELCKTKSTSSNYCFSQRIQCPGSIKHNAVKRFTTSALTSSTLNRLYE